MMKFHIAYKIINQISEGKEFLREFPDNDLIIRKIEKVEIKRIQMDYPGFFPRDKEILKEEFVLLSITIISKKIGINGYPKCKIYLKIKDLANEIKDIEDLGDFEIVRLIISK